MQHHHPSARPDAVTIAQSLWDIGAVHVRFDDPVRLPHAQPSPIFIDTRRVFSHPVHRRRIVESLIRAIQPPGGERIKVVIGDETAGIPLAAWVADRLNVALVYVRKAPKGHGLPNLVEGGDVDDRAGVLVTDLVNVGESILPGLRQIQKRQGRIEQVIAVVKRSPNPDYQPYAPMGIELSGLTHVRDVIAAGRDGGHISKQIADRLHAYIESAASEQVYVDMMQACAA